jgi:hypothetical protein
MVGEGSVLIAGAIEPTLLIIANQRVKEVQV